MQKLRKLERRRNVEQLISLETFPVMTFQNSNIYHGNMALVISVIKIEMFPLNIEHYSYNFTTHLMS